MNISFSSLRANWHFLSILALCACLHPIPVARAAVHQSWVQHWDGGFPAKANKPVAMKLDSAGNICIVASAANSSNLLDYATFKYTSDGNLLWSRRYGTSNGMMNAPRAMVLDADDNIYVTGTSATIKYSSEGGDTIWTAPYAGRDLSVQGTNLFVVGFSETNFVTAKLSTDGTTLWTRVFPDFPGWPHVSQGVIANPDGGAYVVGTISSWWTKNGYRRKPILISYSSDGAENFRNMTIATIDFGGSRVFQPSVVLSESGLAFWGVYDLGFGIWRVGNVDSSASDAMAFDLAAGPFVVFGNSIYVTGMDLYYSGPMMVCTGEFRKQGWQQQQTVFPAGLNSTVGEGLAIAADKHGNSFSAGYVHGSRPSDLAVMSCDVNGNLRWARQYNGQADGTDVGTAIAIASSGDVYVAGYSTLAQGGTEMVLIKYSEYAAIQKSPDGMLLQFPGSTGQQYKIQSSTNLPNWTDIGIATTTPEGLVIFTDTNTTQHPFRFYQTVTTSP